MAEAAFIVPVPEAEPFVGRLRAQFDPSARLGVPAHITVLYPFKPPELITAADLGALDNLFAALPTFRFTLAEVHCFAESIYLAPEPEAPFLALTHAVVRAFPDYPPYAGQGRAVVPHLTVAKASGSQQAALEAELRALLPMPPGIEAACTRVVLVENSTGRWITLRAFALGA